MHAAQHIHDSFPDGLAGLASHADARRRNAGGYQLQPERLPLLNDALHRISPRAKAVQLDQVATAARRVLERYPMGARPAFVDSRMRAMAHLRQLVADLGWNADAGVRDCVQVLDAYLDNPDDLLPDHLPSIGLLDDALLVDLALQTLRAEIADYEDFCQFRRMAADVAGMDPRDSGISRASWYAQLQSTAHAGQEWAHDQGRGFGAPGMHHDGTIGAHARFGHRFVADPRVSLFHIT